MFLPSNIRYTIYFVTIILKTPVLLLQKDFFTMRSKNYGFYSLTEHCTTFKLMFHLLQTKLVYHDHFRSVLLQYPEILLVIPDKSTLSHI